MTRQIRLTIYDVVSGELSLPNGGRHVCFVYLKSGSACLSKCGGKEALSVDEGRFADGVLAVEEGSEAWVYEMAPVEAEFLPADIVLSHRASLPFQGGMVLRADRIESPHGAQTPRHGHRGPGMRRLVYGQIRAEIGGEVRRIRAGEAWFESGVDPVVGTNYGGTNAAFVRLLVLPGELEGGLSSFVPAGPEEAKKKRILSNKVFAERSVSRTG